MEYPRVSNVKEDSSHGGTAGPKSLEFEQEERLYENKDGASFSSCDIDIGSQTRVAPVGAAADSPVQGSENNNVWNTSDNSFKGLSSSTQDQALVTMSQRDDDGDNNDDESEGELTSALLALTSHLAQVQLRLSQVLKADDTGKKENMLKDLEKFVEGGVPDVHGVLRCMDKSTPSHSPVHNSTERGSGCSTASDGPVRGDGSSDIELTVLPRLQTQLAELETSAYEKGLSGIPTALRLRKQTTILELLKENLDLDMSSLEELSHLSGEQLQSAVNQAAKKVVKPIKAKEKMVEQLSTQVKDLERFVGYLQGECGSPGPLGQGVCQCATTEETQDGSNSCPKEKKEKEESGNTQGSWSSGSMGKAMEMAHMFVVTQLGCGRRRHVPAPGPDSDKCAPSDVGDIAHDLEYRKLVSQLEKSVDNILEEVAHSSKEYATVSLQSDDTSSEDEQIHFQYEYSQKGGMVTALVRKELCVHLKELMEHGLVEADCDGRSLIPFGCFSGRRNDKPEPPLEKTAWDVILTYYDIKNGKEYNECPVHRLSEAYGLQVVGAHRVPAKQTLLGAIGEVISSHGPLKRSPDAHLKALICIGLNQKKLAQWMRQIYSVNSLVEKTYCGWSYACQTEFADIVRSLDQLTAVEFHLPVNMAVKQLQELKDAF